jgi:hypothetical protein
MSNFIYKNPLGGIQVETPWTVTSLESTYGVNYSVYNIGGYMEVYTLSDLNYFVPSGVTGPIEFSGNTIPVRFSVRPFSTATDNVELWGDGISSGRRRLGMLVFVHETQQTYQFTIPNYDALWSAATNTTGCVEFNDGIYTINNRYPLGPLGQDLPAGQALIEAWTGSTIEGVNGVTRNNARWKVFWGTDWQVTGGTISYNDKGTLSLTSNSGNTVNIEGFKTITGGTYNTGTTTLSLYNNLGESIDISGFTSGGSSLSVSANTGLGIESQSLFTIYNSTLSPTLEMINDVGGLPSGTAVSDLTGYTFVQMFNDILFPTVYPTYTIPTITLQGLNSGTHEVGSTVAIDINAYGVKNDAGIYSTLYVRENSSVVLTDNSPTTSSVTNLSPQFGFTNRNNPNSGFTSFIYSDTLTVPAPSVGNTSTTTYDAQGDYLSGNTLYNNKGVLDDRVYDVRESDAPQSGSNGFTSSPPKTITGIYPYFWGVSSTEPTASSIASTISSGGANKVLSQANGTISITFNATEEYLWFAHLGNYTTKTKWYVAEDNKGNIGGTSDLFGAVSTTSVNSPETYWSGINFKVYISNYPTTTEGEMDLLNQ